MKSFGTYISKQMFLFTLFILALLTVNIILFGIAFHQIISNDNGSTSPSRMLETVAAASTIQSLSPEASETLHQNHIWAMYLNEDGSCFWQFDLPADVPKHYSIQDVALFSKGYISDYPVFVRTTESGIIILGYPKDSYTKLISNYYPIAVIKRTPVYIASVLCLNLLLLFAAYFLSKRKILRNTEPIIAAVENLSAGKPVSLHIPGELSDVADSVSHAARLLNRQNEARANWISGVSHDIRTPLSMIMGYAERIAHDKTAGESITGQANIIRQQSVRIKELIQDLNLVSQLEYDMQPLHKEAVRMSKLIRSYIAELLNTGISDNYHLDLTITSEAENAALDCDSRLISRAINNLVQNSIKHNPDGCDITLLLETTNDFLVLTIMDNGTGFSSEKLQELEQKPHYLNSMDERLDLRHGLGILIVNQIVNAHQGKMEIHNVLPHGCKIVLSFPQQTKEFLSVP